MEIQKLTTLGVIIGEKTGRAMSFTRCLEMGMGGKKQEKVAVHGERWDLNEREKL